MLFTKPAEASESRPAFRIADARRRDGQYDQSSLSCEPLGSICGVALKPQNQSHRRSTEQTGRCKPLVIASVLLFQSQLVRAFPHSPRIEIASGLAGMNLVRQISVVRAAGGTCSAIRRLGRRISLPPSHRRRMPSRALTGPMRFCPTTKRADR